MSKFLLIFLCLSVAGSNLSARDSNTPSEHLIPRQDPVVSDNFIPELGIMYRAAAQGTTRLAHFTFDRGPSCVTEDWVAADHTAQTHDFWHVADGTELDGGTWGSLLPLEGSQSLWCGADGPVTAAEDMVLCGYALLPGYGNDWDQAFCLRDCLIGISGVTVDVSVMWDSEPGYDATTLQVDQCDGNWVNVYGGLGVWDGNGTDTLSIPVSDTTHTGFLRLRFSFISDGAWSDSDGQWNTDGAFLLDQLTVSDTSGVRVAYEDFEDETPGANDADDWQTCTPLPYGDYSALYPGLSQIQEDPCYSENDCLWAYIEGSTATYSCGGWPSQVAIPYMNARNQYIYNTVVSPEISTLGSTGSVWEMRFDVYRDLQLDALVFYTWAVRSVDVSGCPSGWGGDGFIRYGGGKDWLRSTFSIGQYLEQGVTAISLAVGARDMCGFWCGVYGTGSCHSHAPLIDDVEVYRVASYGPQWAGRDIDMFQDNFPEDGTTTGTARADMAQDILANTSAGIRPGDSVRVDVVDPDAGVGFHVPGDTSSSAAVYFYCSVDGPNSGATTGLLGDARYNYIGASMISGRTWHQIQMDSTFNVAGGLVQDRYNIDLNDNLFVPGDTVWFFFGARSAPPSGLSTYWALPVPTATAQTGDINLAAANPDEFTILPTLGYKDILYVDGMDFRGAQPFFDTSFEMIKVMDQVDRYDIRGPSSGVGNHPGALVKSVWQLLDTYYMIFWNVGDLETAFADGSGTPDKSDDTGLLFSFLDNRAGTGGGVYLSGDDVADKWLNILSSPSAIQLRTKYMTFGLASADHVPGYGITPLVVGDAGGMFQDGFGVDTMVVYGGCPLINDFDVLTAGGNARVEMSYHGKGITGGAVISDTTTNAVGNTVGFILSGFSYHYIRDARAIGIPVRAEHIHRIHTWLQDIADYPVDLPKTVLSVNDLRQNYPNPFNPTTTIKYQVKVDGRVTLNVYNVAGQLIRTLVDETVKAGLIHEVKWNGDNNAGSRVSSGVYFYKLTTGDYTQTKKMVVLK
jgi:hypothetical protein